MLNIEDKIAMSSDSGATSLSMSTPTAAAGGPIRVLVVDDHKVMRQGLRAMLETYCEFTVVGEAGDGKAAIHAADQCNPNVVLMDINMPEMNGIEATRQIKSTHPAIRVVGLSMLNSPEAREAMLQPGATSFVTKSAEAREICDAVLAAARAS